MGSASFDENGLVFTAYALHIQKGTLRIGYADIRGMNKRNTPGFVPNGISILTKDGAAHKFAVNKRDDSLAFLQKPRTDRKAGKRNGDQ